MEQAFLSDPFYLNLPSLHVAKARQISLNPEEEVIRLLKQWAQATGIDIISARSFGFDVPVSQSQQAQGLRGYEYWLEVPETVAVSDNVSLGEMAGGSFIALTIIDPFVDPFDRIPKGWQALINYIRDNKIKVLWNEPGSCLEEVINQDSVTCMNLMIRLG